MLLGDSFALACRGVGWELKLIIAGIERLHAATRIRSRPLMRWHVLAVAMVSGERQTHVAEQRRQQGAVRLEMPAAPSGRKRQAEKGPVASSTADYVR